MKAKRNLIPTWLLVAATLPAVVQAQFNYTITNGTITITNYTGPGGVLTIPATIDVAGTNLPVTSLGESAFENCSSLTSVMIPNSVTSLGEEVFGWCTSLTNVTIPNSVTKLAVLAFYGCSSLTTVPIPNSVTTVSEGAFYNCASLTHVNIPDSVISIGDWAFFGCSLTSVAIPTNVTHIGDAAFGGCPTLTTITVNTNNPAYSSRAGVLFNKNQTILIEYPLGLVGTYSIPTSVTSLGNDAFAGCGLTNVTIPGSVTNLGDSAFDECYSLTSVTLGNSVASIGDYAFANCSSLTNATIPNSLINIGIRAFAGCTRLASVAILNSLIGSYEFAGCSSLTNITIGSSVTNIEDGAFDGCALTSVTIPDSLSSIGDYAFFGCSLTSVTIGTNVTSIGVEAFEGCALTSVTLPDSVSYLGDGAFADCTSLTSVYFQGNAPSLGSEVFDYSVGSPGEGNQIWDPATIYYLPGTTGWALNFGGLPAFVWDPLSELTWTFINGMITIWGYTGPGGAVSIPDAINVAGTNLPVTSIGIQAFSGCTNLTRVTIPNSVTNIGDEAFAGCTSLMAITVDPLNSVYGDLDGVLFDQSLATLIQYPGGLAGNYTVPNSVNSIGNYAFADCWSLTSVTIGTNVTSIGDSAFSGCTSLTSVVIPNSVTNLGDSALAGCLSLTRVYFQGNAPNLGSDVFDCWFREPFGGQHQVWDPATIYYLPGTTGWGTNYGASWDGVGFFPGLPTALWVPQIQTSIPIFGVKTNQFGFNITWASGLTVVVEASTSLVNPNWSRVATNTLDQNGLSYFSDPAWTNYPSRFYRIRSP